MPSPFRLIPCCEYNVQITLLIRTRRAMGRLGCVQFFDRSTVEPPAVFRGGAAQQERFDLAAFMRETDERRSQGSPTSQRLSIADSEILTSLSKLFRHKCSFCESKVPTRAHLFRPPQEAEPLARSQFAHLYYTWLRTDWGNVYAACGDCAAASRNQFPVRDATRGRLPTAEEIERFANEDYGLWRWPHNDQRLLLDPCEDRSLVSHLSFDRLGGVQAFTEKGAMTIATFQLDRLPLVQARAAVFQDYLGLLHDELVRGVSPNSFDFAGLEFGGAWYLLLRRIMDRAGRRMDRTFQTGKDKIQQQVERLWSTPIGRATFEAALGDVNNPIERRTVQRHPSRERVRRIATVRVSNFKALESLEINVPPRILENLETNREPEASSLLILGENATGKSTILEAIALALSDEKQRQRLGRPPESFVLNAELLGSQDIPHQGTSSVQVLFEDGEHLDLFITDHFQEGGALDGLPPVFAYGAFRQYPSGSTKRPAAGHVVTLFRSEMILSNPEAWLLDLPDDHFAMVIRALKRILTIEGEFDVVERDSINQRCLIVTQVGDGAGRRIVKTPLSMVSSGFRSVLAMVCDILRGLLQSQNRIGRKSFAELEAVLLIDEVEAHLHPRWKMQIMVALRKVFPSATIIATTHDPLCLRGMHDGEVVVFLRSTQGDEVGTSELPMTVETIVQLPNVENLTIEQLLTSDFFAMFSTDSPDAELKVSRLGELISRRAQGVALTPSEIASLEELDRQVLGALPLGSSEVQRLVQEAVATYLQERKQSSVSRMKSLRQQTKTAIVKALEGY
ncbi:hypothetical protein CN884_02050 [Ochrobactrum sp. 30A/1000/2015]|nr:hypothetical protein CN884_02050 [Ochrobactrum sp. 30A/1000/2015]PJT38626.1 hypothetical protein CN883_12665 [Ochrobactrum sp. 27A/999/2015]PJT44642.1 hypothetical protein CN882_02050 [Ochrobactrum sp. 23A/997/2015]